MDPAETEGPDVVTPGVAAAMLGITRQGVHRAMKEGRLDCTIVRGPDMRDYYFISTPALLGYAEQLGVDLSDELRDTEQTDLFQ